MTVNRVDAMRALCANLDDSIQMAIEDRLPIRALELIELARTYLQGCIEGIEEKSVEVEVELKRSSGEAKS